MKTNLLIRLSYACAGLFFLVNLCACNYQGMEDQASVRTWKKQMPEMDERTVPTQDGFQSLLSADPKSLVNPLAPTSGSIEHGKQAYGYFCVHCHGPNADGLGTVGQSFSPLPADLRSSPVQSQSDGELYGKIRLGYKRHPRLFTTIGESDTWAVIDYMRSLKSREPAVRR